MSNASASSASTSAPAAAAAAAGSFASQGGGGAGETGKLAAALAASLALGCRGDVETASPPTALLGAPEPCAVRPRAAGAAAGTGAAEARGKALARLAGSVTSRQCASGCAAAGGLPLALPRLHEHMRAARYNRACAQEGHTAWQLTQIVEKTRLEKVHFLVASHRANDAMWSCRAC